MIAPLFVSIKGTMLDLTQCISFRVEESPDNPEDSDDEFELVVETRHHVHHFRFTSREEAIDFLNSIRLRLRGAGHEVPEF